MPRIRSIKPEFWSSEQVMECSPLARLLFIGMWNFCDDGGRHRASLKTIKAEVFPSDALTTDDLAKLIFELVANELLDEYEVNGEKYWQVTGWKHQKIEHPTYKHPNQEGFVERSPNTRRTGSEASPPNGTERNGGESKGVEGNLKPGGGIFKRVTKELLADDAALIEWTESAQTKKPQVVEDNEQALILVFGAAEHCIEDGKNPAALFVDLVKNKRWKSVTHPQEERGRKRLLDHRRQTTGPPSSIAAEVASRLPKTKKVHAQT